MPDLISALIAARAQRENAAESRLPVGVLIAVVITSLSQAFYRHAAGRLHQPEIHALMRRSSGALA